MENSDLMRFTRTEKWQINHLPVLTLQKFIAKISSDIATGGLKANGLNE